MRLDNLQEKQEGVKRQIEKRMAQKEKAKEKLECQSEAIRNKISERMGDKSKLKMRLERRERELETAEAKYQDKIMVLKEKEIELGKRNSLILKSMERNREEMAKWRRELENTPFYELDTEMDHIMTNFKILYENSMLYAKEVFFEGKLGMEMMFRQFINHYGDLEILDGGKRFRFKLNRFDGKGLTKKAVKACEIFNEKKIKTVDGFLLEIVVKR